MKEYIFSERSDKTVCRTWKGMGDNVDFEVTVMLKPLLSGLLEGRIFMENYHEIQDIVAVDFPWRTTPCQPDGGILSGDCDIGLIFLVKNCEPRVYQQGKQALMLLAFLNADNTGHYFDVHDPDCYISKTTIFQFNQDKTHVSGGLQSSQRFLFIT